MGVRINRRTVIAAIGTVLVLGGACSSDDTAETSAVSPVEESEAEDGTAADIGEPGSPGAGSGVGGGGGGGNGGGGAGGGGGDGGGGGPTSTAPPAAPAPIETDLIDGELEWGSEVAPDDGAGGSATASRSGTTAMVLRAEALEGYNGRGYASSWLYRSIDTGGLFDDPAVTGIEVTVEYSASARGVLRAPFDRHSEFTLLTRMSPLQEELLVKESHATDSNPGPGAEVTIDRRFDDRIMSTVVAPGDTVDFVLLAVCSVGSGSKAFGLSEHGFCDFMAANRYVELSELRVVFTPILS